MSSFGPRECAHGCARYGVGARGGVVGKIRAERQRRRCFLARVGSLPTCPAAEFRSGGASCELVRGRDRPECGGCWHTGELGGHGSTASGRTWNGETRRGCCGGTAAARKGAFATALYLGVEKGAADDPRRVTCDEIGVSFVALSTDTASTESGMMAGDVQTAICGCGGRGGGGV